VLFTANGAHCSLRRYLLAIGDAGVAVSITVNSYGDLPNGLRSSSRGNFFLSAKYSLSAHVGT